MFSVMILAASAQPIPCGFEVPDRPVATVFPKMATLEVWDPIDSFDTFETEHFAIKWGPDLPHPTQIDALAADLESTWTAQVDTLGWERPPGTEAYKLNVYLGSTGGDIPTIDFEGGYVWLDEEGIPYIVLTSQILNWYDQNPSYQNPIGLVAHEFNHTLQMRVEFNEDLRERMFWEATANFVTPYSTGTPPSEESVNWAPYLITPHLSWQSYGNPLSEVFRPRSQRQYQAALFLYDLAENQGFGPDRVRDAWQTGFPDGFIAALEEDLGAPILDHYSSFAMRHAVGLHPLADTYASSNDSWLAYLDWEDRRIADRPRGTGTDGWTRVGRLPEGLAWNYILWDSDLVGAVEIAVEPDAFGSDGTPADLQTWVVHNDMPQRFEQAIELEVEDGDEVHLIVVTGPGEVRETFGYDYAITAIDAAEVEPSVASTEDREQSQFVCGCSSTAPAGSFVLLLVPLLLRRRR